MLFEEFLTGLSQGHFGSHLTGLKLADGAGTEFAGQGALEWRSDVDLSLTATTNGAEHLKPKPLGFPVAPGTIIPDGQFLKLTGTTMDGWTVTAERILKGGFDFHLSQTAVVWNLSRNNILCDVEWTKPVDLKSSAIDLLLDGISLPYWPRDSVETYDNPYFKRRMTSKDWLECTPATGIVAARRLTESQILVRAHCESIELQAKLANAIPLAFSFLAGRTAVLLGYQTQLAGQMRRVLPGFQPNRKQNLISPPLGTNLQLGGFFETFLKSAINFFLTEQGQEIGNLLYACWDSADNASTTNVMVICTVVESLVTLLEEKEDVVSPLTAEQLKKLTDFVTESAFGGSFKRRFDGFLTNINSPNVKNTLNRWAQEGRNGITIDEVAAWSALRNAAAHGKRIFTGPIEKRQSQTNRRYLVENLINRLVLGAMGYDANFLDYADWKSKPFPPVKSAAAGG